MRLLTAVVLTVSVAGCGPSIKSSSANHVIVESYQMNDAKAQQVADAECAKYRRRASVTLKPTAREDERDYIFACVD
jgi:hypothetical protein